MLVLPLLIALTVTISLLPPASLINPNSAGQLNLYNQLTDLRTLFGDSNAVIQSLPKRIKPIIDLDRKRSNINHRLKGIEYIKRDYNNIADHRVTGYDTPTAIAKNLLGENKKMTIITGEPGSGKTVALTKILTELRSAKPTTWSIMVDLAKADTNSFEPKKLFLETMDAEQMAIFEKLLETNPEKVNIILDNLDMVEVLTAKHKIYQYLRELHGKKVGIVLATTPNTGPTLSRPSDLTLQAAIKDKSIQFLDIPSLEPKEIDLVLPKQLEITLKSNLNPEYAKTIEKIIETTPIPKNFENIERLCELIVSGDKSVFTGEKFMGLREYLQGDQANPAEFGKILETTKLNKMILYERLTANYVPSSETATYYGLRSIEKLIGRYPPTMSNNWNLDPLAGIAKYSGDGSEFKIVRRIGTQIQFVYPEYDRYFATKALIDQIKTGSVDYINNMIAFLKDKKHVEIVELIDAAMALEEPGTFDSVFNKIVENSLSTDVLDSAISYKFDEVAAGVLKEMKASKVTKYLAIDAKNPFKQSNSMHEFGMLKPDAELHLHDRQEMLFRNDMKKSVKAIDDMIKINKLKPKHVWRREDVARYADEVIRTDPTVEGFITLLERLPQSLLEQPFLIERLGQSVSRGGLKYQAIIDEFISRHGSHTHEVLLQGAVTNRDLPLLKYLVETKNIPLTGTKPLLITALDANPLPRYSQAGFWQVMEYLIENKAIDMSEINKMSFKVQEISPTAVEQASAIKLIMGSKDQTVLKAAIEDFKVSESFSKLHNSPGPLEKLPPAMRELRRNYILSSADSKVQYIIDDPKTLTEVLLKSRGLDTLSIAEQAAYENSIKLALKQDLQKPLTAKQIRRIRHNLVDNIGTSADLDLAKSLLEMDDVKTSLSVDQRMKIEHVAKEALLNVEKMQSGKPLLQKITFKDGVSLTRNNAYARMQPQVLSTDTSANELSFKQNSPSLACDIVF